MKILYVATISDTLNAFLVPHISFLIDQGHEVDIACNVEGEISPDLLDIGCKVYNIEFQRAPFRKENYIAYKKIKRLILLEKYELVHTHTPSASFLTRMACRNIPDLKILYTAHGFHFFKGAPLKNWIIYYTLEKIAARWTDGLIVMNEEDYAAANKMKLRKANAFYKVHGVGIDLNRFKSQTIDKKILLRNEYGYKADDFILIFAGELNHRKHQDLLIDVISLLKNKIPNIKLLLAGSGSLLAQYKQQADRLGIAKNVDFLGHRKDVAKLKMLSDVAVSSSRQEGLPVNVMEAMATGLPLVVADARGNRDLVTNNKNGYVVGGDDIEGFANAIEKLYSSEKTRRKFSQNSLMSIDTYSIKNVIKELEEIYSVYVSSINTTYRAAEYL